MRPIRFALDQGFPLPIVRCLQQYLPATLELHHLPEIDGRLCRDLADWEVIRALHRWKPPFDGLVTVDSSMTSLPREMCVLQQTRMTLVVPEKAGHDPLMATGLLLAHLPRIAKVNDRRKGQVWCLRASENRDLHRAAGQVLNKLAERHGEAFQPFFNRHKLTTVELQARPFAAPSG